MISRFPRSRITTSTQAFWRVDAGMGITMTMGEWGLAGGGAPVAHPDPPRAAGAPIVFQLRGGCRWASLFSRFRTPEPLIVRHFHAHP